MVVDFSTELSELFYWYVEVMFFFLFLPERPEATKKNLTFHEKKFEIIIIQRKNNSL
jgi:hypothetical protein